MQNNSIQVVGLQKSYKQHQVVRGVDLEVEKGSNAETDYLMDKGVAGYWINVQNKLKTPARDIEAESFFR